MNAPIFALCYLPPHGALGTPPAVSFAEITALALDSTQRTLFAALALERDLALYEDGAPVSFPGGNNLPDFLAADDADARYYRLFTYQMEIGARYHVKVLTQRAEFELELREALAPRRAALLGREYSPPRHALPSENQDLLAECQVAFSAARDARQALFAIARCRLAFFSRYEKFEFSLDQLIRYALVTMTLEEAVV